MKTWKSYENAVEKGPMQISVKVIASIAVLIAMVWGIGLVFGWFGSTVKVAKQEFGPQAMLQKYEWFKDASAELDKKKADIAVYDQRVENLNADYEGVARKDWPRTDREQMSVWQSEVAGVRASYNSLAAEYNAQMTKFNWRFANVGDLPQGANVALPREYKPYEEK